MGAIKKVVKKITSLPSWKIFLLLLIIGLAFLIIGKTLASTKPTSANNTTETTVKTEQEEKLAGILSEMEGAGEVEVIIFGKDDATGVLVLAEGADDPIVKIKIKQAVKTVMQTDDSKIKIEKKKS